ncbi:Uncharacterized conserved protein YdiU, UPF0061 family [Desulfonispora thiosulfatigenes DSM 11270]|uniref:Protein nucleotidyltransferase YdiU n=2 Tax=Desulfonispora thiosulfatigenes TaxID=83661 RepID=A0A1W1UER3_DESTI|nr:Uncharacterized conserved protein YdiU, UPF0061 family [Desulfonispora thiosulfatigenes DSM 11270]
MDKNEVTEIGWNLENSYKDLPQSLFSHLNLNPVPSPKLVILNHPLAKSLGFNIERLQSSVGVAVLSGSKVPVGSFPLAQSYAGHQFGHFTMLGDGRALLLGEQITPKGERFDIQLKGSGKTPYSRGGDGRASLGAMLREYIISEAMHGLNIPTTRSLAVVTTGEAIIREKKEIGAILTRVASSHIRVGTFQYAANWGSSDNLIALADYTLQRHFPNGDKGENQYLFLLQEVIKKQAMLIAKWQLVGFIHGVMNTDNMVLSGETIDYGPCAFMDTYDPKTVFSSIDRNGRYAYGNQPQIGAWNLARFAETLLPLLDSNKEKAVEIAQNEIKNYNKLFNQFWINGMRAKLGIFNEEPQDEALIEDFLNIMQQYQADFTNTFRALTLGKPEETVFFVNEEFTKWYKLWQSRLDRQEESKESSYQLMKRNNPAIIPRNHRVEEALDAAVKKGDFTVMERLLSVLSNPYTYSKDQEEYAKLPCATNTPYRTFCGT